MKSRCFRGLWLATKQRAGGAPEGTVYRVRIVPGMDLIARTDPEDADNVSILYQVPIGNTIEEETLDEAKLFEAGPFKEVYRFTLDGQAKLIQVPRDKNIKILRATDTPEKYESFDSSGLTLKVNKVPIFTTERSQYYQGYDFQLE